MHRFPRIFVHKKTGVDSKRRRGVAAVSSVTPKPRLERVNARKNIDYQPSAPFDEFEELGGKKSFRIAGNEVEFEEVFQKLGFSGPDDFAIPAAEWDAMKVRSSSEVLLPRSQLDPLISSTVEFSDSLRVNVESDNCVIDVSSSSDLGNNKFEGNIFRFSDSSEGSDAIQLQIQSLDLINEDSPVGRAASVTSDVSKTVIRLDEGVTANEVVSNGNEHVSLRPLIDEDSPVVCAATVTSDVSKTVIRIEDGVTENEVVSNGNKNVSLLGCGGGGIKGVRPPLLAPPPVMSLPIFDQTCSTWDIFRAFGPEDHREVGVVGHGLCRSEVVNGDADGLKNEDEEENNTRRRIGVGGLLLESCSFTTSSNDDDSSSTTTEPMSIISPNGRFACFNTYWEKGDLLGRGSFGSVYEGISDDGFFFAVKEVSLLDQGEEGRQSVYQLEQEIELLSQFEHENIVRYYGTDKDDSKLYIFLELVTKGSLLSLYQKYNLRDSQVSAYTRQILHGLKYLHDRNVVHRDIKCANILVDANGSVKLADFGLAKATKLNDVKSCKGTALWMAPEVVNRKNQGYGLAADIWSLGCTVLEMLTRQFPYSHVECQMQALFKIGKGEPPPVPSALSMEAREFVNECLQVDPSARPSASQLLEHPFVKRTLLPSSCPASPHDLARRF